MEEKIKKIFSELLGVGESEITDETSYNSFEKWDSLKHLEIVSKLEGEFGISIDMDDIIAMNNFRQAVVTVQKYLDKKVY
jgi:acyl carrier protein